MRCSYILYVPLGVNHPAGFVVFAIGEMAGVQLAKAKPYEFGIAELEGSESPPKITTYPCGAPIFFMYRWV